MNDHFSLEGMIEERKDIFKRHYPDSDIRICMHSDIPEDVMEIFESLSRRFIDKSKYHKGDFSLSLEIIHENFDTTYAVQQMKNYHNGQSEQLTYLVDNDVFGEILGRGEIRYDFNSGHMYFEKKPFVGWSENVVPKKGYAHRRLLVMNALTNMFYGLPLNSDTLFCGESEACVSPARRVWEKLVGEGLARMYMEGNHNRYAFLK